MLSVQLHRNKVKYRVFGINDIEGGGGGYTILYNFKIGC